MTEPQIGSIQLDRTVDSILVGPASIAHFDDAQRACAKTLSPDALQRIDALHLAERGSDTTYVR